MLKGAEIRFTESLLFCCLSRGEVEKFDDGEARC